MERSLVSPHPAITELQGDVVRLEAANITLHGLIHTANTNITTANANITALASHLDAAEATLNGRINAVDSNITTLASRLDAANVTLHGQIDEADTAIATADNAISMLKNRLDEAEATIIALTAHVKVPQRIVFVTSETYSGGAIGGIAGAHSKCQTLAIEAGLNGKFKPWLSSSTYWPAKNFVQSDVPYVNTKNGKVADD